MKPLQVLTEALEKRSVTRALTKHDGCISHAADALGIPRARLYRLIARHGLQHLVRRHQGAPPLRGNRAWHALADA